MLLPCLRAPITSCFISSILPPTTTDYYALAATPLSRRDLRATYWLRRHYSFRLPLHTAPASYCRYASLMASSPYSDAAVFRAYVYAASPFAPTLRFMPDVVFRHSGLRCIMRCFRFRCPDVCHDDAAFDTFFRFCHIFIAAYASALLTVAFAMLRYYAIAFAILMRFYYAAWCCRRRLYILPWLRRWFHFHAAFLLPWCCAMSFSFLTRHFIRFAHWFLLLRLRLLMLPPPAAALRLARRLHYSLSLRIFRCLARPLVIACLATSSHAVWLLFLPLSPFSLRFAPMVDCFAADADADSLDARHWFSLLHFRRHYFAFDFAAIDAIWFSILIFSLAFVSDFDCFRHLFLRAAPWCWCWLRFDFAMLMMPFYFADYFLIFHAALMIDYFHCFIFDIYADIFFRFALFLLSRWCWCCRFHWLFSLLLLLAIFADAADYADAFLMLIFADAAAFWCLRFSSFHFDADAALRVAWYFRHFRFCFDCLCDAFTLLFHFDAFIDFDAACCWFFRSAQLSFTFLDRLLPMPLSLICWRQHDADYFLIYFAAIALLMPIHAARDCWCHALRPPLPLCLLAFRFQLYYVIFRLLWYFYAIFILLLRDDTLSFLMILTLFDFHAAIAIFFASFDYDMLMPSFRLFATDVFPHFDFLLRFSSMLHVTCRYDCFDAMPPYLIDFAIRLRCTTYATR